MLRFCMSRLAPVAFATLGVVGSVQAAVNVTSGVVDVATSAVSGRLGSADTDDNNPPAVNGTSGVVSTSAHAVAGPIPPDPNGHPSFPGTDGIASSDAGASIEFIVLPAGLVIDAEAASDNDMVNMDGGIYQGIGSAFFDTYFTVDVLTPFRLVGVGAFDDQDPTAFFMLSGPFGIVHVVFGAGDNGPFDVSGNLVPGEYRMQGSASVNETTGPSGVFGESGSIIANLRIGQYPLGDMNCDGVLSVGDIAGFVLALTNPTQYATTYPNCDTNLADINQNGSITVGDIGGFVALLTGA